MSRVLIKSRLIFSRINGPNIANDVLVLVIKWGIGDSLTARLGKPSWYMRLNVVHKWLLPRPCCNFFGCNCSETLCYHTNIVVLHNFSTFREFAHAIRSRSSFTIGFIYLLYSVLLYKIECFIDVSANNKIDSLTCVIIHDNLMCWLSWNALEFTALCLRL